MPATLRIVLIVSSLLFVALVFHTINRQKLQMRDSLPWLLLCSLLILVALFPGIAIWLSRCFGIKTPSNFIYLAAICALQALMFHLTVQHSKLKQQIRRLIQERAISNYLQSKEKRNLNNETDHFEP